MYEAKGTSDLFIRCDGNDEGRNERAFMVPMASRDRSPMAPLRPGKAFDLEGRSRFVRKDLRW